MTDKATDAITGYHAHVYYAPETRAAAAHLREAIEQRFVVRMGRWHDAPVGPHPQAMYQVAFGPDEFATLVPWLALNRNGLVVFVHPETGDALADHRDHALWMGGLLKLNLKALS